MKKQRQNQACLYVSLSHPFDSCFFLLFLFIFGPVRYSCQAVDRNCRIIIQQFEEAIDAAAAVSAAAATAAAAAATVYQNDDGRLGAAAATTTVDLQELFLRFTLDNTAETTFGVDYLHSLRAREPPPFAAAFDELQDLCLARLIDPFFEFKRRFQLTTAERRIRTLQRELRQFCHQIIADKQRSVAKRAGGGNSNGDESTATTTTHEDLLSLFVRYGTSHGNQAQEMEELTDVILNFMVAGRDTTAAGLAWTFYELSKQPRIVQAIIAEAATVLGPPDAARYTFEGLNKLQYTHCVVLEALRLHPPVPSDSKFAIRSDTWPDGTYIPARSLITYQPYAMGHNEEIYGPDVLDFRPERFLNLGTTTKTTTEPSPFSFSVFNAGPRLCLGKPLALLTMKMVLVQLLPRFQFHDVAGHPGTMKWSMVGKMKDGFPVQVSRRHKQD
jgi:cytochrome P450